MGKNSRYGARRRDGRNRNKERDNNNQSNVPYSSIELKDKTNAAFEEYYKVQPIVPAEEFDSFLAALKRDLPVSWRFIGCGKAVEVIHDIFKSRFGESDDNPDSLTSDLQSLEWYPGGRAYQLPISKRALRSSQTHRQLHNFLITETELGHISRQEAVSMVPCLLLDVQPQHNVLDLCAAPGSKTAQLIEALHAGDQPVPSGCVVANDVDNARCYLLVKQALRRHPSPCALIVNADATVMPKLATGQQQQPHLLFDRVLADVICSGDGTFRKCPDMWLKWNPNMGNGVHRLQCNIARRGLQLLAVGGLMLYSTCSLNPVEDEAVLAHLLRNAQGTIELVDVSDQLPQLKRSAGVSSWKVMDRDGRWYSSFDEVPETKRQKLCASLFPPSPAEAEQFHLERSFRILPHTQDTGGFFVALIRKTALLPSQSTKDGGDQQTAAQDQADTADADKIKQLSISSGTEEPPSKRGRSIRGFREEPFSYFTGTDDPRWKEFGFGPHYGVSDGFAVSQMLCRAEGEQAVSRNLYWTNQRVTQLLKHNQQRIKVINAGVRVFGRIDSKYEGGCSFRLAQEGAHIVVPHLGARVLTVAAADMRAVLLNDRNTAIEPLACAADMQQMSEGCVVMQTQVHGSPMSLCTWKGKYTVAAYADKDTRIHMLRLLGHDTRPLEERMMLQRKQGGARNQTSTTNAAEPSATANGTTVPTEEKPAAEVEDHGGDVLNENTNDGDADE